MTAQPGGLRERVVDAVLDVPKYECLRSRGSTFLQMMKDGRLLNQSLHFSDAVLSALVIPQSIAVDEDVEIVTNMLAVALRLNDLNNLYERVYTIWISVQKDLEKMDLFNMILKATLKRLDKDPPDIFFEGGNTNAKACVNMDSLFECTMSACEAFLLGGPNVKDKLKRLFSSYLLSSSPRGWTDAFKGAETVAMFFKYMAQEDFALALDKFAIANDGRDTQLYAEYAEVVKQIYPKPLVEFADIDKVQTTAQVNALAERVAAVRDATLASLLRQLTSQYLRQSFKSKGVPMAPRNTQIITFSTFAAWAEKAAANGWRATEGLPKTVVARVLTGEGKSLIIAMLCVLFAKQHGKRVHVLASTDGLLARDHNEFKDFFAAFSLTSGTDLSQLTNITYCTKRGLDNFYRNTVGTDPFKNTILLVDEVDALIVDDAPNLTYTCLDVDMRDPITDIFEKFVSGTEKQMETERYFPFAYKAVDRARTVEAKGFNRPGGFGLDGNRCIQLGESGKPIVGYSLAMEVRAADLFVHCANCTC